MRPRSSDNRVSISIPRFRVWYGLLLVVFAIFVLRLFYLQVIRHDYYRSAALKGQFKQYEIPAERGIIVAHDGNQLVPIVLNEPVFTVFADPKYVKDSKSAAESVQKIIGGDAGSYEKAMKSDTRYAVLAKKLPKDKAEAIDKLKIKGLGTRAIEQRTYPQGQMASQILGFVNDEGKGTYGVEQFLDDQLKGQPGELKAITDASGVPLVANRDNVSRDPVDGKRVALTIDISMQRRLEDLLKAHLESVKSSSGSTVILDANTGAIKAMANYPTYSPADFSKVEDPAVFTNASVSSPLEVGSVMKTLTVAAGIDTGAITANTTYYDPAKYQIGDSVVRNVEEDGGAATRSVSDILKLSLNTGATYVLMQMGGGKLSEQGRIKWHDYMTNHYMFGKKTGVEQGYEAEGYVPSPTEGYGLDIQYANTSFGQGVNITPLQFTAAFSSIINGGVYYRPHIVEPTDPAQSQVVKSDVVKPDVSAAMRGLVENDVNNAYTFLKRPGYRVGGKTGTAQVPKPGGGYYDDRYNGTFIGYVGGDKPEYVIFVRVNEPHVNGYAGIAAAAPMFNRALDMLIQNYAVQGVGH